MRCYFRQYLPRFFDKASEKVSFYKSLIRMSCRELHVDSKRPTSTLPVEKLKIDGSSSFIAYRKYSPSKPSKDIGVIFFQGLMSNMNGSKAQFLEKYCRSKSLNYICFDYIGHGYSSGKFQDFTIGLWKRNAKDVLTKLADGPQIIVGSSIGAWLMLLTALENPDKIHGLIGIASAPDFLYRRYVDLTEVEKLNIEKQGYFPLTSDYSEEPYRVPLETIKEASNHTLLGNPTIPIDCSVRLIHGMDDSTVPYQLSLELAEKLNTDDVIVHLIKDGDRILIFLLNA